MNIQMKAISAISVLFGRIVVLATTLFSLLSLWMKFIQMKATEQYFLVVLFIMLYKVVFNFEFVD